MPKKEIDLITEMHTDIQWMKSKMESMDKKYAKKWVEKGAIASISTIGVAIIGAVMGLILIKPLRASLAHLITILV